jgi:hypothetical protein
MGRRAQINERQPSYEGIGIVCRIHSLGVPARAVGINQSLRDPLRVRFQELTIHFAVAPFEQFIEPSSELWSDGELYGHNLILGVMP